MPHIAVSILDLDFNDLRSNLKELQDIGVTHIHLDVIDTSFCDNISLGLSIINTVLRYDFKFDLHIMVAHPLTILDKIDLTRIEYVAVHHDYWDVVNYLKDKPTIPGLAVSPAEPLPDYNLEYALVMLVEPGAGGQTLMEECIPKIEWLKRRGVYTGVDGGVNIGTIGLVKNADFIVVGSALANSSDKAEVFNQLFKRAHI